ncbi:hypothetical protein RHSIM_Rhsim03G0182800 [Rhododendron simsii]|uniref:Uncharacterized protein n=1 Tax=Rhododendron simsii TaxID=118357 RepID=A0A834HIQ3_RHOSS|nr:hypothetical protein RHSIM_Rhsim03G0182800 [Rhododendron simsii]
MIQIPTTISLWDQFSEYEASDFVKLPGVFPSAIGLRLKLSTYYGGHLAIRGPSAFIFNPPIPKATALHTWCVANTNKINELLWITPASLQRAIQKEPNADEIVKITNLAISIDQVI